MSTRLFSAANSITPTMLIASDIRVDDEHFPTQSRRGQKYPWEDGMLWPNSRTMQNGMGMISEDASTNASRFKPWTEESGTAARKKLIGTTRGPGGTPLGGVNVQAIQAAGGVAADGTATSDSSGYYEIPVANPTGNYKVDAYLAGSPDVAGTTINTLVPV